MPQVAFDRRNRTRRPELLAPVEHKSQHRFQAAPFSGHHGRHELIPEPAITEVRALPDALQAGICRESTKFGLLQEEREASCKHSHHRSKEDDSRLYE